MSYGPRVEAAVHRRLCRRLGISLSWDLTVQARAVPKLYCEAQEWQRGHELSRTKSNTHEIRSQPGSSRLATNERKTTRGTSSTTRTAKARLILVIPMSRLVAVGRALLADPDWALRSQGIRSQSRAGIIKKDAMFIVRETSYVCHWCSCFQSILCEAYTIAEDSNLRFTLRRHLELDVRKDFWLLF